MKKLKYIAFLFLLLLSACNVFQPTPSVNPNTYYRMEYGRNAKAIETVKDISVALSNDSTEKMSLIPQNEIHNQSLNYSLIYNTNISDDRYHSTKMEIEPLKFVYATIETYTQFKPAGESPFGKIFYKEPDPGMEDFNQDYVVYLQIEEEINEEERLLYVRYWHNYSILLRLDKDNNVSIFSEVLNRRGSVIDENTGLKVLNDEYSSSYCIYADGTVAQSNVKTKDYSADAHTIKNELLDFSPSPIGDYLVEKYFDLFKDSQGNYDMTPLTDINANIDPKNEKFIHFNEILNLSDDLYLNFYNLSNIFYLRNHSYYSDPSYYEDSRVLNIEGNTLKGFKRNPIFLEVPDYITKIEDFIPDSFDDDFERNPAGIYIPSTVKEVSDHALMDNEVIKVSAVFVEYTKEECPFEVALSNASAKVYYKGEFVWLGNVCVPIEQHLAKGDITLIPCDPDEVPPPSTSSSATSSVTTTYVPTTTGQIIVPVYSYTLYFENTLLWDDIYYSYDGSSLTNEEGVVTKPLIDMIGHTLDGNEVYSFLVPWDVEFFTITGTSKDNQVETVQIDKLNIDTLYIPKKEVDGKINFEMENFNTIIIDHYYGVPSKPLFFRTSLNWTDCSYIYWLKNGETNAPYPGEKMELIDELYGKVYTLMIPKNTVKIQFFGNNNGVIESSVEITDIDNVHSYYIYYDEKMDAFNYEIKWEEEMEPNPDSGSKIFYFEDLLYLQEVYFELYENNQILEESEELDIGVLALRGAHGYPVYMVRTEETFMQQIVISGTYIVLEEIDGITEQITKTFKSPIINIEENMVYYAEENVEDGTFICNSYSYDEIKENQDIVISYISLFFENRLYWSEVYLYYVDSNGVENKEVPGELMCDIIIESFNNYDTYEIVIPSNVQYIIFYGIGDDGLESSVKISDLDKNRVYYLIEDSQNSEYSYNFFQVN